MWTALMLAVLGSACMAANKATSVKFDSFWKAEPTTVAIPVGMADGTTQLKFPAMPQKQGEVPVIRFKAYLKTPTFAGWSQYLKLNLNGKVLGSVLDETKSRVLNRERLAITDVGTWSTYKEDAILTFFGPSGDMVDPRVQTDKDEACWYLMDVSDAANKVIIGVDDRIESQEPNTLTLTNTYHQLDSGETAACREMVIENFEAGYVPESEVKGLRHNDMLQVKPAVGPSVSTGSAKITVAKDGAIQLSIGGESYFFAGLYSYPGKDTMGFNSMGMPNNSAADWKIVRTLDSKHGDIVVVGEWKNYRITRTIVPDNGRFHIHDKVTNKTDKPLGMAIKYNAITNKPFADGSVHICGSATLVNTPNCGTNPSLFIKQNKSSMGLVVEDSVFRLQMAMTRMENRVEYATKNFGLEPKKSYTIDWTIYPSKSTDFWNFVNRVRNDWKVNYTVLGPCPLGDEKVVPGRRSLLYPLTPWFRYYSQGEKLTPVEYKKLVQPKIKKLLAAQPDAIPMALVETNLVPFDTRKSKVAIPGGTRDRKDVERVGYGHELTKEQTEYVKTLPWWDSQIKTSDGRGVVDTYYSAVPYCNLMVYPAPGNYHLKYMLWQVDFLMDNVGMKGIYIDQFNLGLKLEQPGRSDYSKWDGHTVDLKPSGEIDRKYTDATLVGSPARAQIVKHILSKGGVVITNGHPVTRETTGLPMMAMAETEWDLSSPQDLLAWKEPPYMPAILEANLSSPIGLGIRPNRFNDYGKEHCAEIIQKWVITCLKNGTLYYYYTYDIPKTGPGAGDYGIINHMFPFTPVELHAGWLIGKERILTAKSGDFFWNHPTRPIVLVFDSKGYSAKPKSLKITKKNNGWKVLLGIKDWQQTAVIKDPAEK